MGIRQFETAVERIHVRQWFVHLQSPLTVKASDDLPDVGFVTTLMFTGNPFYGPGTTGQPYLLCLIERETTWMKNRGSGPPKRKLKGQTRTVDRLSLYTTGTLSVSHTDYGVESVYPPLPKVGSNNRWSVLRSSTSGLSFDAETYFAMLRGVCELKQGQPLIDWLTEYSAEALPMLTEPGWMPKTWVEFRDVKKKRDDAYNAMMAKQRAVEAAQNEEELSSDRWR